MWSQEYSEEQTKKIESYFNGEADSGFQSIDESIASMRGCSENAALELSEAFIRNLSLKHANMNNLETERSQHKSEPIVNGSRLEYRWSELERADVPKQSYEFFRQDSSGDTQLHLSIMMNHVEAALWLINIVPHPCLLDVANDETQTALHLAVMTREPKIVRRLVLAGANANLRNAVGNTPLHIACALGDLECARALTEPSTNLERNRSAGNAQLASPSSMELRNYTGKTCLHIAAMKGHALLVEQLLRAGANVDCKEALAGKTALHLAIESGHREVVHCLAQGRRSCLNAVTYAGDSAYQIALDVDRQLAEELLRLGALPLLRRVDNSSDSNNSSEDDSD